VRPDRHTESLGPRHRLPHDVRVAAVPPAGDVRRRHPAQNLFVGADRVRAERFSMSLFRSMYIFVSPPLGISCGLSTLTAEG
jgi:hypothetical protein